MAGTAARLGFALVWLFALGARADAEPKIVRPTERPFLYRIEGSPPSFLYGTIHVPDDRVLALPRSVRIALRNSDTLLVELQLDEHAKQVLQTGLSLPAGQTLDGVLPVELRARLERYLASKGLPFEAFKRLKLIALAAQIEVLDYLGSKRAALDLQLMQQATQQHKPILALEQPEEQIAALDSITFEEQVAVFDEELERLEKQAPDEPTPVEKMVRAYVAGDEKVLWAESMAYVDLSNPTHVKFMDALFARRNARFAERIEARLEAEPARSYFVAVGALHLFGPDGVIARLEKRGHTLVRLEGNAAP
jgi:hypothetical protein